MRCHHLFLSFVTILVSCKPVTSGTDTLQANHGNSGIGDELSTDGGVREVFGFQLPSNCNKLDKFFEDGHLKQFLNSTIGKVQASVRNCPQGGCFDFKTGENGSAVKTFTITDGKQNGSQEAGISVQVNNDITTTMPSFDGEDASHSGTNQTVITFGVGGKYSWGKNEKGEEVTETQTFDSIKKIMDNSDAKQSLKAKLYAICQHSKANDASTDGDSSGQSVTMQVGLPAEQNLPGKSSIEYINKRTKLVNIFSARLGLACFQNYYDENNKSKGYNKYFHSNFLERTLQQLPNRISLYENAKGTIPKRSTYMSKISSLKSQLKISAGKVGVEFPKGDKSSKAKLQQIFKDITLVEFLYNNSIANTSSRSGSLEDLDTLGDGFAGDDKQIQGYLAAQLPCSESFKSVKTLSHGHVDLGAHGTVDNTANISNSEVESTQSKIDVTARLGVGLTIYFNPSYSGSLIMAKNVGLVKSFADLVYLDSSVLGK